MNIAMPKGIKSPTVSIVIGGTMTGNEKSNKIHEKRMDMLERKLDQQYKNKSEGRNYTKDIESIQRSFVSSLNKFVNTTKQSMSSQNEKLLNALKNTVSKEVKIIQETPKGNGELKTFIKKISSLEDTIRKISLKSKTVNVTKQVNLDSSFEKLFARMEKAIKEAKPRLSPSPS
jgi:dsDNA-specific endonuclease/ATPase MutS2